MKITKELCDELGCPSTPVLHDGKWFVASEFRLANANELFWNTYNRTIRQTAISHALGNRDYLSAIFTPCELPPKPDDATLIRLAPVGKRLVLDDAPSLDKVPYVDIYGKYLWSDNYSRSTRGEQHFHGLRWGVSIVDDVPATKLLTLADVPIGAVAVNIKWFEKGEYLVTGKSLSAGGMGLTIAGLISAKDSTEIDRWYWPKGGKDE